MFEHQWWLAALALLPVVRWLHRYRAAAAATRVAALFLWRSDAFTGTRDTRRQPPDPAWRRRGALVALLVLALAGPRWPGNRGAPVVVWLDDSQSLYARDGDDTRMARALHDLSLALDAADPAQIEVRSLADPTAILDLTDLPAAARTGALADWTRAPRGEPHLPLPVALDTQQEHWLVTDGADSDVASWAGSARLARIVQAGTECANAAVTLLALRVPIEAAAPLAGLVEITNGCGVAVQRRLRIKAGDVVVVDQSLALAADARTQRAFSTPGYTRVRATLGAGDPLPLDDTLEIDSAALAPVATRLVGACPASISAALRAHPRLLIGADSPVLEIDCGDVRQVSDSARHVHLATPGKTTPLQGPLAWMTAGPLRTVTLDARWLRRSQRAPDGVPILTDGDTPLITRNAEGLDVALALGLPPFDSRPEQAALLAGLIDEAMGRELLGEIVRASLPATAARIAPLPLPALSARSLTLASTRAIAPVFLAAALLVLLYDLARTPGMAPRLARGGVALLCVLAWWNPAVPFRKVPLEVALVLDESQSMPEGASENAWQTLRSRAFPPGSRVSVTRFGAAPVDAGSFDASALPAHVPARFAVDPSRTDIAAALAQALRERTHEDVVVLASDAVENAGDASTLLAQAHAAGIPVLLLAPETSGTSRASIDAVSVPANAFARQPIPLAVQITAPAASTLEIEDGGRSTQWPVAPGTRTLQIWLDPAPQRSRTLALRLLDQTDGSVLDERVQTVALGGAPAVLVVTRAARSALAESLRAGGRRLTIAAPGAMEQALDSIDGADVVILDDIAADEASEAGWNALARAVHNGTGLAVLGGSHSFIAGRYHATTIETLLPVISSPPRQQPAAAVMFVIDKSGSMGRETTVGATRFALARQAVLDSARALPSSDFVGMLAFDVSTRTALPLQPAGATAIERTWTFSASGGTALAPALDAAIDALAAAPPEQRLLVLATDGFVLDESLDALIARIERAHIDVIALAIGDEPDLAVLRRLTAVNDGALEQVTDVATLPRLMSAALAGRRAGIERGQIAPMQRLAPPFFTGEWPALDAYAVTTPRPGARVYLTSPLGDPLIAMDERGAGRVVALTAGLGDWARNWQTWPRLPALLGGMIDWLGTRTNARVHAQVMEHGAEPWLEIDAAENDRWSSAASARVTWLDPADGVSVVAAQASAPGRFSVKLPLAGAGDYRAEIDAGGARTSARYTRASSPELHPDDAARGAAQRWLASGVLQRWPAGLDATRAASSSPRNVLLVLALALFVATLLARVWRLRDRTVARRARRSGGAVATVRT